MKKLLCLLLFGATFSKAQVGIGTSYPRATLDINSILSSDETSDQSFSDGILLPQFTKADLAQNQVGFYGTDQIGALIYVNNVDDVTSGPSLVQVSNILSEGVYYLDFDLKWQILRYIKTEPSKGNNIYKGDGELSGNRVVDQLTNNATILFDSNITNAFSIKNNITTLSVDTSSNRVGIGTTSPNSSLHINSDKGFGLRLEDSTAAEDKVLINENSGFGNWKPNPLKSSVLGEYTTNTNSAINVSTNNFMDSKITLRKGRWFIFMGELINTNGPSTADNNMLIRISLSSQNNSISNNGFSFIDENDSIFGYLSPSVINGKGYSLIKGLIPINVTVDEITLYPYFSELITTANYSSSLSPYITSDDNQSFFYAIAQNQVTAIQ